MERHEPADAGMSEQFPALRRALLSWYPFEHAERVLLIGEDTEAFIPLLDPFFDNIDQMRFLPDEGPDGGGRQYDCVIALDCLEHHAELVGQRLSRLAAQLRPEGSLLLGFRNRFGLRYLCGGLDDIVRTPYSGIAGETGEGTKLFATQEMTALLRGAGFAEIRY